MGAPDLIFELRNAGYSIKADGQYLDISPADDLAPELVQQLKQRKAEILAVLKLEARREKVLAMLEADPAINRAINTDNDSDPDNIILTIAIRHLGTCEMLVPRANYDPWQLLALLDNSLVRSVN